jgi:hypothetical protein
MTMSSPDQHQNVSASAQTDQALTMTVHPLPDAYPTANKQRSARLKLLLLALVCVAPVVASYLTYYVIRPEGRRNNGELIDPQRPIPNIEGTTLTGKAVNLQSLKGQWLLIAVAGGSCDAACQKNLYFQRQLRESTGKDSDRIDRVWLINDEADVPSNLLPALDNATVLRVNAGQLAQWLTPSEGNGLTSQMYVVDPIGNWMMRFKPHMDISEAAKAKKDLNQLLKASSFWDKAGRP